VSHSLHSPASMPGPSLLSLAKRTSFAFDRLSLHHLHGDMATRPLKTTATSKPPTGLSSLLTRSIVRWIQRS
jgi:hypothetical protein